MDVALELVDFCLRFGFLVLCVLCVSCNRNEFALGWVDCGFRLLVLGLLPWAGMGLWFVYELFGLILVFC